MAPGAPVDIATDAQKNDPDQFTLKINRPHLRSSENLNLQDILGSFPPCLKEKRDKLWLSGKVAHTERRMC